MLHQVIWTLASGMDRTAGCRPNRTMFISNEHRPRLNAPYAATALMTAKLMRIAPVSAVPAAALLFATLILNEPAATVDTKAIVLPPLLPD